MSETDQILPALAKAQALYPTVGKLKKGHYGKYADLVSIMESVRGPNTEAGLIVIHRSDYMWTDVGTVHYHETRVYHVESGQSICARLRIDTDLSEQSLGKALTYARRYCLMGLLGICADEDTDAQEPHDEQEARKATRKSVAASAGKKDPKAEWWANVRVLMAETLPDTEHQDAAVRALFKELGADDTAHLFKLGLQASAMQKLRERYAVPPPSDKEF